MGGWNKSLARMVYANVHEVLVSNHEEVRAVPYKVPPAMCFEAHQAVKDQMQGARA